MKTLQNTTAAVIGNGTTYISSLAQLKALTGQRNTIAAHMIQMMEGAAFGSLPFNDIAAQVHIALGQNLLDSVP